MAQIPKLSKPVAIDRVLYNINDGLAAGLPWLNYAFGRAQRIQKRAANQKTYALPNVWKGGNDYTDVTPDQGLGNFSFWRVDDPVTITNYPGQPARLSYICSLVVWYDCRKVIEGGERNTEMVKEQVLFLLSGGIHMPEGHITVGKVWEQAENIYKGYTLNEVDNQFLTHPFAGMRIECTLIVDMSCE